MSTKHRFAFPQPWGSETMGVPAAGTQEGGLTKRELFAAMMLQTIIGLNHRNTALSSDEEELTTGEVFSKRAVSWADALIAELAKEPPASEAEG